METFTQIFMWLNKIYFKNIRLIMELNTYSSKINNFFNINNIINVSIYWNNKYKTYVIRIKSAFHKTKASEIRAIHNDCKS